MSNNTTNCEEQIARLSKEFEDFVYIVSHDLKAPVRAISNLSVWIEEDLGDNIPDDVRSNIKLLRNRTERLERMITALLQVSRVNRYDLDIKLVDLNETLKDVTCPLQSQQVSISLPSDLPSITTYYKKLQQVFDQLLRNAIKYSNKEKIEIIITAEDKGDVIHFQIQDNGPGIQPQSSDKIFNIFYTGRSKDTDEAVGAGLAIVKQIIDFVGGTIELLPAGTGCTFFIIWPKILEKNI